MAFFKGNVQSGYLGGLGHKIGFWFHLDNKQYLQSDFKREQVRGICETVVTEWAIDWLDQ